MSNKILIITNNLHQLEKGFLLKNNLSETVDLVYTGKSEFINDSKNIGEFSKIAPELLIKKNLAEYISVIVFTLHANRNNLKLHTKCRVMKIPIICFQETHQLTIRNNNIYNITLSPDLIVCASNLESRLIQKKNLFIKEKLYDQGWAFQSFQNESNLKLKTKDILIVFGASSNISPSSDEEFEVKNNLVKYISRLYPNKFIDIKEHPQDLKSKMYLNYSVNPKQLSVIKPNTSLKEIFSNYKTVFCSQNTQSLIDLMHHQQKIFVFNCGNENKIFQDLRGKKIKVNNSIKIKEYNKELEFENLQKKFFKPITFNDTFMSNLLKEVSKCDAQYLFNTEKILWNNFLNNKKDLDGLSEEFKDVFINFKRINFKKLLAEACSASIQSAIFLIIIRNILLSKDKRIFFNQSFIDNFFRPFIIENFPYQSLIYYLFIKRNRLKLNITKQNIVILENIYKSLLNKVLSRIGLKNILNFLALERSANNIFTYHVLRLLLKGIILKDSHQFF